MSRRRSKLTVALLGLVAVTLAAVPAVGQSSPQAFLLILDGSGSMWGQIEGTAKIQIAKQTLTTLIDGLPADARVGFMAYGHRRDKDCDDVELVVPVGPLDKESLKRAVAAITPKSMTPIQRSLQRAVEIARTLQEGGELTVVLVSDGKETCDPDPCGTVRQLKASGAKFVAHVIGFDVGAEEREQLACIAEAAGGKYYSAANAADLMFAAQAATSTLVEAPASGEGRVWIDSPATATAGGTITAHFEAAKTFHANAWIGVVPSDIPHGSEEINDAHDLSYEYVRGRTTGTATLPAPSAAGKYDIRLHDSDQDGREVASASFTVTLAGARVWLDGTSFPTGTPLVIHFEASSQLGRQAWIGIIPSDIPHGSADTNDSNDVTYAWVADQKAGTVTLTAPSTPGSWDARLNDGTGNGASEIASATFSLTRPTARVWLDSSKVAAGASFTVHFEVSAPLGPSAWIGIIPSDVEHGSADTNDSNDVTYAWVRGEAKGDVTLIAPEEPGSWDARLNDADSGGAEIASVSFHVE